MVNKFDLFIIVNKFNVYGICLFFFFWRVRRFYKILNYPIISIVVIFEYAFEIKF